MHSVCAHTAYYAVRNMPKCTSLEYILISDFLKSLAEFASLLAIAHYRNTTSSSLLSTTSSDSLQVVH